MICHQAKHSSVLTEKIVWVNILLLYKNFYSITFRNFFLAVSSVGCITVDICSVNLRVLQWIVLHNLKTYAEPRETSNIEPLTKTVNWFQLLTFLTKTLVWDIW